MQKDEQLWDIAKTYRTTVKKICDVNGIEQKNVKKGDKIILIKACN